MSERGAALGLAIVALTVVGGLVSAAFLIGLQQQRLGGSTLRQQEALAAAYGAAHQAVEQWNPSVYNALPIGATVSGIGAGDGPGWHRWAIRRLNQALFLAQVEGFSRDSTARHAVGLVLQLSPLAFPARAALLASGRVDLLGGARVSGADVPPGNWIGCPEAEGEVLGIGTPHGTGPDFDHLRYHASTILAGGHYRIGPALAQGECQRQVRTNWGDPFQPGTACGSYFPVVWVDGNITLEGGAGQGVLLVDGDLALGGGFEFYGVVWVRGTLKTASAGGRIHGTAMASDVMLRQPGVLGDPVIGFSSCAVAHALASSAVATPLRPRGWVEIY